MNHRFKALPKTRPRIEWKYENTFTQWQSLFKAKRQVIQTFHKLKRGCGKRQLASFYVNFWIHHKKT